MCRPMYRPSCLNGYNPNAIPGIQTSLTGVYPSYRHATRSSSRQSYDRFETETLEDCHDYQSGQIATAICHRQTKNVLPEFHPISNIKEEGIKKYFPTTQPTTTNFVLALDDNSSGQFHSTLTFKTVKSLTGLGKRKIDVDNLINNDSLINRIYSTKTSTHFYPESYPFYYKERFQVNKQERERKPEVMSTESFEDEDDEDNIAIDKKRTNIHEDNIDGHIAKNRTSCSPINFKEQEYQYKEVNKI